MTLHDDLTYRASSVNRLKVTRRAATILAPLYSMMPQKSGAAATRAGISSRDACQRFDVQLRDSVFAVMILTNG